MVVNLFWKWSFLVEASTPLPTNSPEDGYVKSASESLESGTINDSVDC